MKKTNQKVLLTLCTSLMLAPLVACGGKTGSDKIIMWSTFNDTYTKVIDHVVASLNSKYPEFKFEHQHHTGTYADLAKEIEKGAQTGNYPDLAPVYPDSVASFINAVIELDITDYMNSTDQIEAVYIDPDTKEKTVETETLGWTQADLDDIPEQYLEQTYEIPGKFSLPFCKSTEAMYYNRSLLFPNGNGLDLSEYNDDINGGERLTDAYLSRMTWDQFFELADAILQYNNDHPFLTAVKNENPAIMCVNSDDNFFIHLAAQYQLPYTSVKHGAGSIDFVEKTNGKFSGVPEEWMNVILKFANAVNKKYLITTGSSTETTKSLYLGGASVFSIGSSAGTVHNLGQKAEESWSTLVPQASLEENRIKVIDQGPSIAFLNRGKTPDQKDKHARGAWLFYKELTNFEYNTEWAITANYAPIRQSILTTPEWNTHTTTSSNKSAQQNLDAMTARYTGEVTNYLFSNEVFTGSASVRTAAGKILGTIFKAAKSPSITNVYTDSFRNTVIQAFKDGFESI